MIQFLLKDKTSWTCLVVQGLRILLPRQGTWVQSLAGEDSMYYRAAKPVHCNYRSLCTLQPVLCHKRSHHSEKPVNCRPVQLKIWINKKKFFLKIRLPTSLHAKVCRWQLPAFRKELVWLTSSSLCPSPNPLANWRFWFLGAKLRRRKLVEARKGTVLVNLCCCYKHHRLGVLNNIYLFLTVLETGSPRSGCWPVSTWWELSS